MLLRFVPTFAYFSLLVPLVTWAGRTTVLTHKSALHVQNANSQNACVDGSRGGFWAGGNNSTRTSCSWKDEAQIIAESTYELSSPAAPEADNLGSKLGVPQTIDAARSQEILERIASAQTYMDEVVAIDEKYAKVRDLCDNKNANCAFWAVIGECENNPGYMKLNCGPVCKSCEQLHVETRCPMDPDAVDALYPGTLTHMFEGILANPDFQKYEISVLSRPTLAPGDTEETADYFVGGPWVIMLDNALSSEEADRLIELGGIEGYERSADVGHQKADGTFTAETNSGRTSTNAWCQHDCYKDPTARAVMDRVANITSIPEVNSEYLQMLQYEKSQFYQTHSDYIPYQVNRPTGVRILTFYFYLSDVEEGGGTNFPKLGLTVTPKKGRAVLWPSVLDDEPNQKDARSDHQALPVIKGVKYGANAWIHQRDYKTWSQKGC